MYSGLSRYLPRMAAQNASSSARRSTGSSAYCAQTLSPRRRETPAPPTVRRNSRLFMCVKMGVFCGPATSFQAMAQSYSFDVTTGVDLQEVDNAINQAQKEIAQRYDFKGSKATIEFNRAEAVLVLAADNDFQ